MSASESGVSTRKRKVATDVQNTEEAVDKKEEALTCRKSPRLSACKVKEAPTTPTRGRPRSRANTEESKLNGAQFVTAAAAGNLNLTNSINEENDKMKSKKGEMEKIQPDKLKKSEEGKKPKIEQDQSTEEEETQCEQEADKQSDDQIVLLESEATNETRNEEQTECINLPEIIVVPVESQAQTHTQTIKLVDTPIEEAGIKPSNGLLSSDVNLSSETSSSEDEDSSNGGKKSSGTKSGNIAILNKTKIDTDFISKLIGNRFPDDKRYDPNEINKLRLLSHSYQNFAVKLLVRLFDEEEIIGRNVYGRNYSGDKSITKQPLDPERINFIKETVLRLTKTNNPELAWASCVIAMNRKMVDINNKYFKNLKNKKSEDDEN